MITKEQKRNHLCPAVLECKNVHCNGKIYNAYRPTLYDFMTTYVSAAVHSDGDTTHRTSRLHVSNAICTAFTETGMAEWRGSLVVSVFD